jgi:putative flippase GtrA
MVSEFIKRNHTFIRFLVAGAWNTVFGYGVFIALSVLPLNLHYVIVLIISNILGITNAYLCYKYFVFKTRGNHAREYARFYVIYGITFVINLLLLPVLVEVFKISPVIAQGFLIVVIIFGSYFGHKYFSFHHGKAISTS